MRRRGDVLRELFCPRHPKLRMTASGRLWRGGEPIMHCAVCIEQMRAKLKLLMALPYKSSNGRFKQVVLPPVAAWER